MLKTLLLSHPILLEHGRLDHPENRSRLTAILSRIQSASLGDALDLSLDRLASFAELTQIHSENYVNKILLSDGKESMVDYETPLSKYSVKAARVAAGLGIELIEQIIDRRIENGFALVRPPGHHARPTQGMGFCIFNNIAIAAKVALLRGVQRILILDWDVHHGNGTQEAFYQDERVLFIDLHQDSLFPKFSGALTERGEGSGYGYTVNIPLPHSSKDEDYLYVLENLVRPLAIQYKPELILVSAGFDAHENDPLGSMRVTTQGFGFLVQKIKDLASVLCEGRLVLFLEGGYEASHLANNVAECIQVLSGDLISLNNSLKLPEPREEVISLTRTIYESYYKIFT